MTEKCLLCFSESVYETDDENHPFACHDCSAWGATADDISNPDTSEEDYRFGQVLRKPRAA